MNNAKRVATNLRNSIFLILLSFILLLTVQSSESKEYLANSEEVSEPSLSENDENNDWVLIPGTTKLLQVQFQGNAEDVFFEFSASEDESSTFKISTIINGKAVHTENKEFLQEETLIANIDYQNKDVSVIGDHGFSISHAIQEDFYQIVVFQKRVLDLDQELSLTGSKNSRKYKVILGTVGGTCGLAGVLIIFGFVWKKRKATVKGDIPQCSEIGKFNVKSIQSTAANKDCELQHTKSDFEVGSKLVLDDNFKKASPSTQTASTLATLAKLETQGFNTDKSFLSSASKDGDLESIPEIDNDQKHSPYVSLPKKETPQNTKQNAKFPPKRKSQSIFETEIALDLEVDLDNGGRRMPTVAEIKALVRKMEEEGEIPCECDPSEDTDEEDQYEAPALPNYFCCMICYEGRRCTIVEPCRHVFACHDCVKELLDTYKICILCTRAIDSYESM